MMVQVSSTLVNVIDNVIVNKCNMKSVEVNDVDDVTVSSAANFCDNDSQIPPPDTVMRFVETTETRVDTDARPSVNDLGETIVEEPVIETMPSVADTCEETIKRPSTEAIPDVIGSVVDTIDITEVELPNTIDITQNHKKFKRKSWHPADVNQGSDNKDVDVVTSKRRTATENMKIDENRFKVGNKRIFKDIVFFP
ncbi:hypothetical protein LIER_23968 [Lithospermum erythrorhizon]|uniref:Uncharacterized protein n=1 Tax=Lithospermum erythrorhizon TaxID=34254 RepID=A0AAV3R0T3_LITER